MTVLFCLGSSLVCTEPRMSPRSVEITALVRAVNGTSQNFVVSLVSYIILAEKHLNFTVTFIMFTLFKCLFSSA